MLSVNELLWAASYVSW